MSSRSISGGERIRGNGFGLEDAEISDSDQEESDNSQGSSVDEEEERGP